MSKICFETIFLLTQAQNVTNLEHIIKGALNPSRNPNNIVANEAAKLLSLDNEQSQKLIQSVRLLGDAAADLEPSQIQRLFPASFPTDLKTLLVKFLIESRRGHKLNATEGELQQRMMPSLVDVNWRVDTKVASNVIHRISVPTCLLQLKIQRGNESYADPSTVHIELTKDAMDTMLDGLGRIREQLSTISK